MGQIAGIFPIGDTGENFVIAEWMPDPDIIAQELFKLAADTENWTEPLNEARQAFIYDTELHFETQSDPYGKPWTALDEGYLKNKLAQGFPEDILVRDGALKRAATSQESWFITERDIVFQSDKLPFYGPYHQSGTIGSEISDILNKLRTGQDLTSAEAGVVLGSGKGKNLPQRMFIGADEDTIAEIEGIFINWLDRVIGEDIPPHTSFTGITAFGGGSILRGTKGRFAGVFRGQL